MYKIFKSLDISIYKVMFNSVCIISLAIKKHPNPSRTREVVHVEMQGIQDKWQKQRKKDKSILNNVL